MHNIISVLCARIPLAYLASKYVPDNLFPWDVPLRLVPCCLW